jgi:hypothetical protein
VLGLITLLFVLCLPFAAAAASKTSVLLYVEGARVDEVRSDITKALGPDVDLVDPDPIEQAFKKRGIAGKLATLMDSKAGRKKIQAATRSALGTAKAQVAIIALSKKAKREIVLLGFEAGEDEAVLDETVTQKKNEKEAQRVERLAMALEPALPEPAAAEPEAPAKEAAAAPSKAETPEKEEEAPPPAEGPSEPEPAGPPGKRGYYNALFALALGGDIVFRRFDYTDPLFGDIRPYSIDFAPIPYVALELFPMARSNQAVLKDLGVFFSFSRSFGLKSEGEGLSSETTFQRWRAGIEGRLPFALGDNFGMVTFDASYGNTSFEIDDSNRIGAAAPSVKYDILRLGIGGRVPLGKPVLLGGFGYQLVLGSGPFEDRFPHASAGGIDARLGAALPLAEVLEARLWFEYTRFFFNLQPEPDDRAVAGGALDQYFGLHLELGLFL